MAMAVDESVVATFRGSNDTSLAFMIRAAYSRPESAFMVGGER